MNTEEQVLVKVCGFGGVQRGNDFGRELIRRNEVEAKVRRLKNGNSPSKDEVTGEMIKGGGDMDMVIDWRWRLCNVAFESGLPEDWRSAVIVSLYNGKGERTECRNYGDNSLLSMVG